MAVQFLRANAWKAGAASGPTDGRGEKTGGIARSMAVLTRKFGDSLRRARADSIRPARLNTPFPALCYTDEWRHFLHERGH